MSSTPLLDYLTQAVSATATQVFLFLGPLLLLAFIMNFVARGTAYASSRVFGSRGFWQVFGWLGTAVHELGHALFAVLFAHKITEMKLYDPDPESGSLGHVRHTYNPKSLYQQVGNFFIGIGPILLGSGMLFVVTYVLFDVNLFHATNQARIDAGMFQGVDALVGTASSLYASFIKLSLAIVRGPSFNWWKALIFLYLLFAIGSSITLSKPDIRGAARGFAFLLAALLMFNLATFWLGSVPADALAYASAYVSSLSFLMALSMLLNVFLVVALLVVFGCKKALETVYRKLANHP